MQTHNNSKLRATQDATLARMRARTAELDRLREAGFAETIEKASGDAVGVEEALNSLETQE
jgi:hypothetical protein